jgi:hypothetical protein
METITVIDCGIKSCAFYDVCLTKDDRLTNGCEEDAIVASYQADAETGEPLVGHK